LGTVFSFDASSVSDVEDDTALLQVRWDFENDGVWDTDWSQEKNGNTSILYHRY
jgi:hypothetical protein